jgi:hypothetical protein
MAGSAYGRREVLGAGGARGLSGWKAAIQTLRKSARNRDGRRDSADQLPGQLVLDPEGNDIEGVLRGGD